MSNKWKMVLMFALWVFWQVFVHLVAMSSLLKGAWPVARDLCFAIGGGCVAMFALILVQNARYDDDEDESPTERYFREGNSVYTHPVKHRDCREIHIGEKP
jgi:hypothetical protein